MMITDLVKQLRKLVESTELAVQNIKNDGVENFSPRQAE